MMNERSAQIINTIWEHSPELILLTDLEGHVQAANPACLQFAGLTAGEITGQHFSVIFPPESRFELLNAFQPIFNQSQPVGEPYEIEAGLRDGNRLYMETSFIPVAPQEETTGFLLVLHDITPHKRAEIELRQSEERFRTLADYTTDWEYWVDPEGSFIYISPSVERITGYLPQAFFLDPGLIFEITHPDDRSIVYDIFQTSLISSQPLHAEFRIRTAGGEERWIDHASVAVITPEGRYLGRRAANRDHSRQKSLQNSLRRQVEIEQILAEISSLFLNVTAAQLASAIHQSLMMVGEHSQANRCFILEFDSDGSTLVNTHQWRRSDAEHRDAKFQQLIASHPPGSEGWRQNRDVIEYARNWLPGLPDDPDEPGGGAVVAAPLMRSGRLSGYIGMTASPESPAWSSPDYLLLRLTGELVISALDRQHYELELERTSRQLSVILEGVADAITVLDSAGNLVYANTAAAHFAGLRSVDELYQDDGRLQSFLIADASGRQLTTGELPARSLLAGKPHPDRVLRLRPLEGGRERWNMVRSRPVLDSKGRIQYAVSIAHDITELKEAEAALRASGTLYQTTVDAMQDSLMVVDRSLTVLLCNRSMRTWVEQLNPGIEPVGADLSTAFTFLPPEAIKKYREAFDTGETYIFQEHLSVSNRELITETYMIPILEAGRVIRLITLVRDVTIQQKEEERIHIAAWRADLLAGLSSWITEAGLEVAAIYAAIVNFLAENTGAACFLHARQPESHRIELSNAAFPVAGEFASIRQAVGALVANPAAAIARVYESGSSHLLSAAEAGLPEDADGLRLESLMILPLYLQGRVFASLSLLHFGDGWSMVRDDLLFFQDIASRVSLAIENARLYALQAQRARELDALNQATSALLTSLELEALLGKILDAAKRAIPAASNGEIRLLSFDTGELELHPAAAYRDERISYQPEGALSESMQQALKSRQPLRIQDSGIDRQQAGSLLVAPLYTGVKDLGILVLSAAAPHAFSESDRQLLGALGTTAAAALQNARLHAQIQRLAITDELTSLYNRRGLYDVGQREVARAHRFNHPLSAILVDVDDFKQVNDTFGHLCGDQVLQQVARCLEANLRSIDIIGRYGGDEFVILLPETDLFTAEEIAERLGSRVRELTIPYNSELLRMSLSMGLTRVNSQTQSLDALFDQADRALYQAKQRGKDCVEIG